MQESRDLELMLDSRVPLIVIESYDEKRALDMLLTVANRRKKSIYRWSITDGLDKMSFGPGVVSISDNNDPQEILQHIKDTSTPGIYVLCDFHPFLNEQPKTIRLIKDIALNHHSVPNVLVFLSHKFNIPAEVSRYSAAAKLSLPSEEEILSIIRDEAKQWSEQRSGRKVKTDSASLKQLVANLKGMSHAEVRRLARGAIVDDGAITEDDIPEVNKAKFELMNMEGVLSFEYNTEKFSHVGGLSHLKNWLKDRRDVFLENNSDGALDVPKGIMMVGVQGGGKSLAAKSIAGLWGLPLLRLDFGALYNKFFGETERNLREALKLAEVMSPCVLWMDEIEKGLAQDNSESGTSKRVLGTLLTWMSERKSPVFMVATSNDITQLPPELVRKGRLDEIFFVDLPNGGVRADIFAIHLQKRQLPTAQFDLTQLAQAADGFSGAEIEQAIVAAIYSAAAQKSELTTQHILDEIVNTSPLSVVMGEKVAQLRAWADGRAVSAG